MVEEDRIRMDLKLLWESFSLTKKEIEERNSLIIIVKDHFTALKDSVAIAILTEWDEFKKYKWDAISKVSKVYDGRKIILKNDLMVDGKYAFPVENEEDAISIANKYPKCLGFSWNQNTNKIYLHYNISKEKIINKDNKQNENQKRFEWHSLYIKQ